MLQCRQIPTVCKFDYPWRLRATRLLQWPLQTIKIINYSMNFDRKTILFVREHCAPQSSQLTVHSLHWRTELTKWRISSGIKRRLLQGAACVKAHKSADQTMYLFATI